MKAAGGGVRGGGLLAADLGGPLGSWDTVSGGWVPFLPPQARQQEGRKVGYCFWGTRALHGDPYMAPAAPACPWLRGFWDTGFSCETEEVLVPLPSQVPMLDLGLEEEREAAGGGQQHWWGPQGHEARLQAPQGTPCPDFHTQEATTASKEGCPSRAAGGGRGQQLVLWSDKGLGGA